MTRARTRRMREALQGLLVDLQVKEDNWAKIIPNQSIICLRAESHGPNLIKAQGDQVD